MKRLILFLFFVLSLLTPLFCEDFSVRTFFPSKRTISVLPVDSYLGQTVSSDSTEVHKFLEEAITYKYNKDEIYNWFLNYVDEKARTPLSALYQDLLSLLLPSSIHYYSKERVNGDDSISVSVRFLMTLKTENDVEINKDVIISFTVFDNQIIAMSAKNI